MSIVRSRGELVAHAAQIKCAQIALKRYQTDGCAADPHSNDHIQAYLQLRATAGCVSAETFMKYLASRISNAKHGANAEDQYWAVPKQNFPDGLPDKLKANVVSEEDLVQAQILGGGTFDFEGFYILDQDVPRQGLGRNVKLLRVVVGRSTSWGGERLGQPLAALGREDTVELWPVLGGSTSDAHLALPGTHP